MSPNDLQTTPEWLKQELFESVLKEIEPNYVRICKFNVRSATTPGENYATQILRLIIEVELGDGNKRSISFVMKIPIQSEQSVAMIKMMKTFEKEENMYTHIIPELEQLYNDAGVDVKFSGRKYDLPTSCNVERLLLEDLCPRGFKNVNRINGLDMDHTKRVLKKLAQWHAASAVRVETKGKYNETLTEGVFNKEAKPIFCQMTESTFTPLRKCMLSYEGHKTWIADIDFLRHKVIDQMFNLAKVDINEFNVLNHGDCWANNIMFQYDAFNNIKEVYFVDYQVPRYGTPAQDLYYFLLSSTQYEIKIKHFDYFIKYYHDNLIENLKILKYSKPLPKLKQLHQLLYKYGLLGYVTIAGVMALVLLEPSDQANMDNYASDSNAGVTFKLNMYSNPIYRKHMEVLLPWLQARGALEI